MTGKTLVVAQSGGPTPVFNASLAGIVSEAQAKGFSRILGLLHGLEGALNNEFVDLTSLSKEELKVLERTPSAALGGSRHPFYTDEDYAPVLDFFIRNKVDVFLFLGGNGTMGTCHTMLKLKQMTKEKQQDLIINGVPKTVDNDLYGMEYAPGYLSAARYVALATKAQAFDLKAMRHFEQVRILETMGRAVGWLTAASVLARQDYNMSNTSDDNAPHLIYIPEEQVNMQDFLLRVEACHKRYGYCLVVVGEGMKDTDGNSIGYEQFKQDSDPTKSHRPIIVDAAKFMADKVKSELGLTARSQNLGMLQRSFSEAVASKDRILAMKAGKSAVQASVEGVSGRMIWAEGSLPLEIVAGKEQFLPAAYYDKKRCLPTQEFVDWLSPLVAEIPEYLKLF